MNTIKHIQIIFILCISHSLFSNNATILHSGLEEIPTLLKNYCAIKIDATVESTILGDEMSESNKKTTSKLTAISALSDTACVINWHPEQIIIYEQDPSDNKTLIPSDVLSRNSIYFSNNNRIKVYYFNDDDKAKPTINNELLIREFNKGVDSFIATFYTGKIFFPNFVNFYPNFKGGYFSVKDIFQIKPESFNPPKIIRNGDIILVDLETKTNTVKCEINTTNMHLRYIEILYKHKETGAQSLLVRYDYADSIPLSDQIFSLPKTVTRTLYSYDDKKGSKYKLTLNSIELLDKFNINEYMPVLTKGWRVTDMIKKITYTIGESKEDILKSINSISE